jgi:hypothetical protein
MKSFTRSATLVLSVAIMLTACGHPKVPEDKVLADFRANGVEGNGVPMRMPVATRITGQTVDGDFAVVNFVATYSGDVARGQIGVHEEGDRPCAYRFQWQAGWRYVPFSGRCN